MVGVRCKLHRATYLQPKENWTIYCNVGSLRKRKMRGHKLWTFCVVKFFGVKLISHLDAGVHNVYVRVCVTPGRWR